MYKKRVNESRNYEYCMSLMRVIVTLFVAVCNKRMDTSRYSQNGFVD